MDITTTDSALLRLLQLSSASLPVGGYSFSQGLETAVEKGWLGDAGVVRDWLSQQLHESQARVDLPLLLRQLWALRSGDLTQLSYWNDYALACRETAELRTTDIAMAEALIKLLGQLAVPVPQPPLAAPSFVTAFAIAGVHWQLATRACCHGYVWAWLENQVAAAVKLVPLGQTSAQRLLGELLEEIPSAVDRAERIADDDIGASLPGLAMASAWHETQYSRLFRS